MLNHIDLMGRLTRDPELRYTQNQVPVASFSIAVDRDFAGRDGGERQTDFIDIVAWQQRGEFVKKYFTKGSMIVVSGRLQIRDWTDRDGNKRRTAEVVADNVYFGESKRSRDEAAAGYGNYGGNTYNNGSPYTGGNAGGNAYSGNAYGGNAGGNAYGGGAPARGGGFGGMDDASGTSAFSDLSDTDGDLPF